MLWKSAAAFLRSLGSPLTETAIRLTATQNLEKSAAYGASVGRLGIHSPTKEDLRENMRWTPETGQVAKRESSLGAAGRPKVRHDQYSKETQS